MPSLYCNSAAFLNATPLPVVQFSVAGTIQCCRYNSVLPVQFSVAGSIHVAGKIECCRYTTFLPVPCVAGTFCCQFDHLYASLPVIQYSVAGPIQCCRSNVLPVVPFVCSIASGTIQCCRSHTVLPVQQRCRYTAVLLVQCLASCTMCAPLPLSVAGPIHLAGPIHCCWYNSVAGTMYCQLYHHKLSNGQSAH